MDGFKQTVGWTWSNKYVLHSLFYQKSMLEMTEDWRETFERKGFQQRMIGPFLRFETAAKRKTIDFQIGTSYDFSRIRHQ